MSMRLLVAMDQFEPGQSALDYAAGLSVESGAAVWVFHVRELPNTRRIPPLETVAESDDLVDDAVIRLRQTGVSAGGRSVSVREKFVANRIAEESLVMSCDAIVLGSWRLTGLRRFSGCGLRDRLLRLSPLPVYIAPAPLPTNASSLRSLARRSERMIATEPSYAQGRHDRGHGDR
jgi:nucleotide-binding universal stress UspA family protein